MEDYQRFVEGALRQTGSDVLLVDDRIVEFLPPVGVPIKGFSEVNSASESIRESHGDFKLIQYTSGSTGDPKGVVLPEASITANLTAISSVLKVRPGDGACSWLPLSHDMGLIGMFLCALWNGGQRRAGGGNIVLIEPEQFVRNPSIWLEACSEFGSTITAAPDFGFLKAAKAEYQPSLDLDSMRVCITGAEPIRFETLDSFSNKFAASGFDDLAICPAYGMAEAALALSITTPNSHWRDSVKPGVASNQMMVSSGVVLPGYDIEVTDPQGSQGRLSVAGPSLLECYADGSDPKVDGRLATNDLGFVERGQVYVAGRCDDVLLVKGRNLLASCIQAAVQQVDGVRPGAAFALQDPTASDYQIAAELEDGYTSQQTKHAIKSAATQVAGLAPSTVLIVERGNLPRTPSGKPRRILAQQRLESGDLELVS